MEPLLGWWIERGPLRTDARLGEVLAAHLAQGRSREAKPRSFTRAALHTLSDGSVTPVLRKGVHTAQVYSPMALVMVLRRDAPSGALDSDSLMSFLWWTDTVRFAYPALALAENLAPGSVPRQSLVRSRQLRRGRPAGSWHR